MNDIEERIRTMLQAEGDTPERDGAGIIDPRAVDCNIRRKAITDCLKVCDGKFYREMKFGPRPNEQEIRWKEQDEAKLTYR